VVLNPPALRAGAADAVLTLHAGFVLFVVAGLLGLLVGAWRGWSWVRNPWFRAAHLGAIVWVVLQTWLGAVCPLTDLEMALRRGTDGTVYRGGFVAHWLQTLLYYDAPPWVFGVCYTLFGVVVVTCWFRIPPRPFRRAGAPDPPHDVGGGA
jgi:hypothetical protein